MIITIASLKGGTGKTALTACLSTRAGERGIRTLASDFDPQGSLTDYLARDLPVKEILSGNTWHLLTERAGVEDIIRPGLFVDVLPAAPQLHTAAAEMASDPGAVLRIAGTLKENGHEIIFIDTPPYLSFELRAALYAADLVLIPVALDRWGRMGLDLLRAEIDKTAKGRGRPLPVLIIPSMCTAKEAEKLRQSLDGNITGADWIRQASIKRAMNKGTQLKADSKAWQAADSLLNEVLEWTEQKEKLKS